eukprot:1146478-Pelagomonas_calceolata.AAC.10
MQQCIHSSPFSLTAFNPVRAPHHLPDSPSHRFLLLHILSLHSTLPMLHVICMISTRWHSVIHQLMGLNNPVNA